MLNGASKKLDLKVCQILVEKVGFEEGRKECLNMDTFGVLWGQALLILKVALRGERGKDKSS